MDIFFLVLIGGAFLFFLFWGGIIALILFAAGRAGKRRGMPPMARPLARRHATGGYVYNDPIIVVPPLDTPDYVQVEVAGNDLFGNNSGFDPTSDPNLDSSDAGGGVDFGNSYDSGGSVDFGNGADPGVSFDSGGSADFGSSTDFSSDSSDFGSSTDFSSSSDSSTGSSDFGSSSDSGSSSSGGDY